MQERFTLTDWMGRALIFAKAASTVGEVPVGAVLVQGDNFIVGAHNATITNQDPTAHAEIEALRKASKILGRYRLTNCSLFVTLEPCAMCFGALVQARIAHVHFATNDPKSGVCGSVIDLSQSKIFNHHPRLSSGVLAEESRTLLQDFFSARRT